MSRRLLCLVVPCASCTSCFPFTFISFFFFFLLRCVISFFIPLCFLFYFISFFSFISFLFIPRNILKEGCQNSPPLLSIFLAPVSSGRIELTVGCSREETSKLAAAFSVDANTSQSIWYWRCKLVQDRLLWQPCLWRFKSSGMSRHDD